MHRDAPLGHATRRLNWNEPLARCAAGKDWALCDDDGVFAFGFGLIETVVRGANQ